MRADRNALFLYARNSVELFWLRQIMFIVATAGSSWHLQSALPVFCYMACFAFEIIDFSIGRKVYAAPDIVTGQEALFERRCEMVAVGGALSIVIYAGVVAALESNVFHFLSVFYLFAAALFAAMFNHMLEGVLKIRLGIYLAGFIAVGGWEILDDWPVVEHRGKQRSREKVKHR